MLPAPVDSKERLFVQPTVEEGCGRGAGGVREGCGRGAGGVREAYK